MAPFKAHMSVVTLKAHKLVAPLKAHMNWWHLSLSQSLHELAAPESKPTQAGGTKFKSKPAQAGGTHIKYPRYFVPA